MTFQLIANQAVLALRNARLFAQAQAVTRAQSDFLNMAAHELRTPLSVIAGYVSMMGDGTLGEVPNGSGAFRSRDGAFASVSIGGGFRGPDRTGASAYSSDAPAEKGDKVTVSFTGTIDGKPFEGGTGKDIGVEIGSNTFIPGFEDQLIGIRSGETRRSETEGATQQTDSSSAPKLLGRPANAPPTPRDTTRQ